MKIDLYLNGELVEINKDIDFVLNKQFTDLTDLTSIIVDYTKTIKVPMTAHNNELFNYTYKLDRNVLVSNEIITYDPTRKIPMTMSFNGSIVMDGYAVLNSVNLKDKVYEINLYGQLGKIFYDLKEKPLKEYTQTDNGFWKNDVRMNNKTIVDSFTHNDRTSSSDSDWASQDWTNFWGFAPQLIGKTDSFDTSTYEVNGATDANRIKNFVDTINATRGISYADIYVGDGFDVNQYQEIRTYMTRPYAYVDSIIKLVQNEINNGNYDGYTMNLDPDWFNNDNPYYKNLCFFPGNESIVDSGESTNGFVTWDNNERSMYFPTTYLPTRTSSDSDMDGYTYSTSNNVVTVENSVSGQPMTAVLSLNCDGIIVRDRVTGVGSTTGFNQNGKWAFYNLPDNSYYIPIRYIGIYDGNGQLLNKLYLCDDTIHSVKEDSGFLYYSHTVLNIGGVWNTLRTMNSKNIVPNTCVWENHSSDNNYCELLQQYNFGNVVLPTNSFSFKLGCDIINFQAYGGRIVRENISYSDYHTLCPFKNDKYKDEVWTSGATFSLNFRPIQTMDVTSNNYRSGSYWSILDVLGNDFNPFTWMIDYAKKFRLFFDIDYTTKTITLKSGYFNNIEYKKVSVDYSKPVIIEPIVDKYKYIDFGYKANESKKGTKYYKKYGVQYGDMTVSTDINLNNETLSLLPDNNESVFIPTDLTCLNYANLNSQDPIRYGNPMFTNHIINTLNSEGEIQYFPFYAFRWPGVGLAAYYLSDDTPYQRNTGKYCYLDRASGWERELMTTQDGYNVYYLHLMLQIPIFDNYITKTVQLRNTHFTRGAATRSVGGGTRSVSQNEVLEPIIDNEELSTFVPEENELYQYDDPVTGETKSVSIAPSSVGAQEDESGSEEPDHTYLFWDTWAVPKEVYNCNLPSNIDNYSIYNKWKNYLNEIFNVQNKKVTCYIRMSYPEFINFKFNQLFVIDNNTFLVNKIIDFNPNSTAPTKVELIQIDDVTNLR